MQWSRIGPISTPSPLNYEKARRTPVEITQHNAEVSLRWFEHMGRYISHKPRYQFAFSLMSRAKALTWDNIWPARPGISSSGRGRILRALPATTPAATVADRPTPMFTPFDLRG